MHFEVVHEFDIPLDAIELRTPALRVVALTAKGPRLAFWGRPGGDNLLLWKPGTLASMLGIPFWLGLR